MEGSALYISSPERSRLTAGGNYQVQRSLVRLKDVLSTAMGGDEPGGTHLLRVGLFALAVRDGRNICSKRLCEEKAEAAEPADSNDSDIFCSLTRSVCGQGIVQSSATT